MTIDKVKVDRSLRNVRGLYRKHAEGELSPSRFITKARTELHALYFEHTMGLIRGTASRFIEEAHSFQAQFGLDLNFDEARLTQVTRGYRGIRASLTLRNKVYTYVPGWIEVFIGPFDEWNKVAVHTLEEQTFSRPSFYTKRRRNRWQKVEDFDFPGLFQRIKEGIEKPRPVHEEDEEIPF